MERKIIIWIIILLLLLQIFIPIISCYEITNKNIIYVDDDNKYGPWDGTLEHPFKNISDGINIANNADTVFVYNGTYQDYEIFIDKSIYLIGEDKSSTIISDGQIILMKGEFSSISGFNINNCFIESENQDYVEIYDNNITGGITIINTIQSYIHHNIINGIEESKPVIEILDGCCSIIEYNIIHNNHEGGIALFGNGNTVSNNTITNNIEKSGYGIRLEGNNNKITDNHISDNVFGIRLGNAHSNKIMRNNFIFNTVNVYLFGILDTIRKTKNIWDYNFWNRPRIFPKLIYGIDMLQIPGAGDLIFWMPIIIIQVDKNPRLIPYEIPTLKYFKN
jgi:parallel beta-helix repeat protein